MTARVVALNPDEAGALGAALVAEHLRKAIAIRGIATLCLAGGTSPTPLYTALAARRDVDWSRVELFLGDERAVPPDDARSNLRAAREALVSKLPAAPAALHPMYTGGDVDTAATACEALLRARLGEGRAFDVLLLGLGRDGHTLSLHPGCGALGERDRDVVALRAPPMDPPLDRVTLTPPMVERARAVLLFAHGASKAAAARATVATAGDEATTPARVIHRARGVSLVLLDEAAGGAARR